MTISCAFTFSRVASTESYPYQDQAAAPSKDERLIASWLDSALTDLMSDDTDKMKAAGRWINRNVVKIDNAVSGATTGTWS